MRKGDDGRYLRFTRGGLVFIAPGDDCRRIVDGMLAIDYREEFCAALDFGAEFLADMMAAGFLIMSAKISPKGTEREYAVLPKLHLERSILFRENVREPKSAKRLFPRYELRHDSDFDTVLDRCVETHGDDWLTPPLCEGLRGVRALGDPRVMPVSFGLYREGRLVAGEFGVRAGRVYTSYSGYHTEKSSGTVQMLLTARWLRERGFAFWDLGMPLDYKGRLGAVNVGPEKFVSLWRGAAEIPFPENSARE